MTELIIIDPQNDFCDPQGELFVPGAEADMRRLSIFIANNLKAISGIQVTLDSHYYVHIAHPIFWENNKGESPPLFTLIKKEDIKGSPPLWRPRNPEFKQKAIHYLNELEKEGHYTLCIWPPHCIIGTWGHNVYPALLEALKDYQTEFGDLVYVLKGSNKFTEQYSALRAEVIDPEDSHTQINEAFLKRLRKADSILFAGEARSHCVASTLIDILKTEEDAFAKKCTLLVDTMSDVSGFEEQGESFIKTMKNLGVRLEKAEKLIL